MAKRPASLLVAAAITIGVLSAGCANSSLSRTETSRTEAALALSRCIRGHGVRSFPDPGASLNGPSNSIGAVVIPSTIDIQAPAFQAAENACRGRLSAVLYPHGRPPISASLKLALIAHAQCMRTHGVSNYQDPRFPASGGIAITDAGVDPDSPAYKHAESVCGTRRGAGAG